MRDSGLALGVPAAITVVGLAVFGFAKGHFTGVSKLKGALQASLVGSLAAGVAYASEALRSPSAPEVDLNHVVRAFQKGWSSWTLLSWSPCHPVTG